MENKYPNKILHEVKAIDFVLFLPKPTKNEKAYSQFHNATKCFLRMYR